MNENDRDFGAMCVAISPRKCYLIDFAKYPNDLSTTLDRVLGKHNEDHSSNLERTPSTSICTISQYVSASIISNEAVHGEEVANSTNQVHVATILFE